MYNTGLDYNHIECIGLLTELIADVRPRSAPALELISRAASSVGVMYRSSGPKTPNTMSNPGGERKLKKNLRRKNMHPKQQLEKCVMKKLSNPQFQKIICFLIINW